MTLEDYLRFCSFELEPLHVIDHVVRHSINEYQNVNFYIHPAKQSGPTVDFVVKGNFLRTKQFSGIERTDELEALREQNRHLLARIAQMEAR